jgi:hypothetical protein
VTRVSAIAARRRIAFQRQQEAVHAQAHTADMTGRSGMLLAFRGGSAMLREVKFRVRATPNKRA